METIQELWDMAKAHKKISIGIAIAILIIIWVV